MNKPPVPHEAQKISIHWYAPGEMRIVEMGGVRLAVRLVERKGRRARIAVVEAPPGRSQYDSGSVIGSVVGRWIDASDQPGPAAS